MNQYTNTLIHQYTTTPIYQYTNNKVIEHAIKIEKQEGNRWRFWGIVEEFDNKVFRVVTLEDKITIHNAFPDRGFKE